MVGVSEGFAIAEKMGADPQLMQAVCNVSSARSWTMDTYNPRPGVCPNAPSSKGYNGGFGVSLIKKDMALAIECAEDVNADHSLTEFAVDYYKNLEVLGRGDKDFGYVFQYILKNKQYKKDD